LEFLEHLQFLDVSFNEIKAHPPIEKKIANFVNRKKIEKDVLFQ
ncbi:unnamed protein product, partial [marine sediment metagenome]